MKMKNSSEGHRRLAAPALLRLYALHGLDRATREAAQDGDKINNMCMYIHTYIYIYMYREREIDREREM